MKSATANLNTHIQGETTTLAQFWKVKRTDGTLFAFTSHDTDLTVDIGDSDGALVYEAETSFKRSAIVNNDALSVDNLDVQGLLASDKIDETELRRGLFDFAEVWVFIANYESLADGFVRMRRGWFGEVTVTPKGIFRTELRGMTQVLARVRSKVYNPECPHDLGDVHCKVPIQPAVLPPATAVAVGDTYRIPLAPPIEGCRVIGMNFEGPDLSTSGVGYDNISGVGVGQPDVRAGGQNISTAQAPRGGDSTSSLFLDGAGDYLQWNNDSRFTFGSNEITIQVSFRPNAIGTTGYLVARYRNNTGDRSWYLRLNAGGTVDWVTFQTDGLTVDVVISGTTVLAAGSNYHIAVTRDSVGDWRMFINGTQEGGTQTPTTDPQASDQELFIGALYSSGIIATINGWIDGVEIMIGHARWTANFTAPTGNFLPAQTTFDYLTELAKVDFIVTVAGTTGNCLEIPDTTVGNTHVQGGATLQAVVPWQTLCTVTALGTDIRKEFTVTELTPNSGGTIAGKDFFPDDSMNGGVVTWLTGSNAGRSMEIKDFVADDGVTITQDLVLFLKMPFDIQVGDKATIYRGCDKSRDTCRDIFANVRNFGGFPDIPGQNIFTYPNAKS